MQAKPIDGNRLYIEGVFPSTPEAVRAALRAVQGHLSANARFAGIDGSWEIVIAEVLNNIVEHAYAESPDGEIHLALTFREDALQAKFTDHGRPMPNGAAPMPCAADIDVPRDDLPEGGFGWFLIQTLVTRLDYRREAGVNHLSLEVPLGAPLP